jgi:hypothetical protein
MNPFKFIACCFNKLTGSKTCEKHHVHRPVNHDVAPKQIIHPDSPDKEEQIDFIAEGGDSQPLKK